MVIYICMHDLNVLGLQIYLVQGILHSSSILMIDVFLKIKYVSTLYTCVYIFKCT